MTVKFMFHVHYSHKSELQIKPVASPGEEPNHAQVADIHIQNSRTKTDLQKKESTENLYFVAYNLL